MQPTDSTDALVGELIDLVLALAAELQALAPTNAPVSPALQRVIDKAIPILEARTQAERRKTAFYRAVLADAR